jgi:uncharacterized repeat protein (TIGR01451 family)
MEAHSDTLSRIRSPLSIYCRFRYFEAEAVNRTPLSRKLSRLFPCLAFAASVGFLAAAPAAAQPTFTKQYSPDTIAPGNTTTLTFTIMNASGTPVTGLEFTDPLATGIVLADPATPVNTCGGTLTAADGGSMIALAGGVVGASSSCTIRVDVTNSPSGPGVYTNTTSDLLSSAGNSGTASDDLTVSLTRLGFSKSFAPDAIQLGGRSTLTFTIDNGFDEALKSGISFSDTLPSGIVLADPVDLSTDCFGTVSVDGPGGSTITHVQGVLVGGASCSISVDVTANAAGSFSNRSSDLSSNVGTNGIAVDELVVGVDTLALRKEFVNDPAAPGGTVMLRLSITNLDRSGTATGVTFSDDLDATLSGLEAVPPLPTDPCGAGSSLSGTSLLTLSNGTLAPGETCTFQVTLAIPAGAADGSYPNTTSDVTALVGGVPTTGSPASDTLFVQTAPILTKTITPDPAASGDTLTIEFTITNPADSAMSGITFEEPFGDFIAGSTVATLPANGYCNGTGNRALTGIDLASVLFFNVNLAAGADCTFSMELETPDNATTGTYTNTTTPIEGQLGGETVTGQAASDTVDLYRAPRLTKELVGDPVQAGGTVVLQFTLEHDLAAPGDATGISFTDDLAATLAGLTAIDTPIADVCGAGSQISGTTNLSFTGGTLAPDASCTFSVTLQVPAGAAPGAYINTTSDVTATVGGLAVTGRPASDDLDVAGLRVTKSFLDDPAVAGGTVTLRFLIENASASFAATDIQFTDDLDDVVPGLAYDGPPLMDFCGMGSQLTGTSTISFSGGSVAPSDSCTFDLVLDVPAGAPAGEYINTTSQVLAVVDGEPVVVAGATDLLQIVDPLSIDKEFTDDPALAGGTVTLELTLTNLHPTEAATGVAFTDDLDAALSGLVATGTPLAACGGTLTGTSLLTFTGGTVAAASSCTVAVTLQVPAAVPSGTVATNTTSPVTGTIDGVGVTGDPASDDLRVEVADFSKSFDGPSTATGTAVLSFTIENLSDTEGLAGLAFSDDLNATLSGLVATGLPMNGVCGAGSQISGTSLLTFTGGILDPGATCSFDVTVQVPAGAAAGTHTNTTSALTASGLEVATPASADLEIEPPPTFAKSFSPAVTGVGVASTLTFTIDNTASALAATGLAFTDTLPAGVTVATPANASTTCTGGTITASPGSGTVSYSGGTVAAGASCTVQADVVAGSSGSFVNVSGELTSSSGSSGTASSTLTVRPAPTVTKTFTPDVIVMGGTSTVTVTIDNSGNVTDATAVTFMDALRAGVVVAAAPNASTTCTGGTITASPGAGSFSYNGGTVPGGTSCTVSVDVTAAAAGSYDNSVTVSSSLGTGAPATDTLEVTGAPAVTKAFSPAEIELGGTTTVIVTIDNSANILPATGLSFTDSLPAGVTVASPVSATTDCTGGTLAAVAGEGSFSYSGGSVAAGAVCAVMVEVTAGEVGPVENLLVVDSSLGQSPEASAVLVVRASLAAIPTAGTWGLLALGLLLAAGALWRLRF